MSQFLKDSDIKRLAPSVYAEHPSSVVSDKYIFVPTTKFIKDLVKLGWHPVEVKESNVKKKEYIGYQRHIIKFQNPSISNLPKDDIIPEFVIVNGHNGKVAWRGLIGYHISLCSNGLIMGDIQSIKRAVHLEYDMEIIKNAVNEIVNMAVKVKKNIKHYKGVVLNENEKLKFAKEAYNLRWKQKSLVDPKNLLDIRRDEDEKNNSLWKIFNIVQENIIKGGVEYLAHNADHEYIDRTRPINQIDREITINLGLWNLLNKFSRKG